MNAAELKTARAAMGVSQVRLAELIGVHPITVSKWERSESWPTSWQSALIRALSTSPRAREIAAHYDAAGLAAALSVGLEHALTGGAK